MLRVAVTMYKVFFLISLFFCSINANAGIFGPSDPRECILKYQNKVRLHDAKNLLEWACLAGYGAGSRNEDTKKSGQCIASNAGDLYSMESSLNVINKCTKDRLVQFDFFKQELYRGVNESAEINRRRNRLQQEDAIKDALKNCTLIGSEVRCY